MVDEESAFEPVSGCIDEARVEVGVPDPGLHVHRLFERHASSQPDRIALELELERADGRRSYTYAELNVAANRLARDLGARGLQPGGLAGLYFDPCPELIISILAVLKLGAAYVPLEPTYPRARLGAMLADARLEVVLSHRGLEQSLAPLFATPQFVDDALENPSVESGDDLTLEVAGSSLAYVIYTSGSTGRPKGVMVEHAGLTNNIQCGIAALRAGSQTRMLQYASIGFDLSVWEIFVCLGAGGTLCLPSQRGPVLTARLGELLRRFDINTITLPPAVLWLLDAAELPNLHQVSAGGEAVPAELAARWSSRRFINLYGPTEVSVICMAAACQGDGRKPGIGFAFPNQEAHIVDPATLELLADGEIGELCISGVGVARGYLRRDELTASAFIREPWSGRGARMYRTGDQARRLADGSFEFISRLDHQVKLNGQRIELGEIESVLREHGGVSDAAVVVRRESSTQQRLVAFVVPKATISTAELTTLLAERLPSVMIPEAIHVLSALPLDVHGKLDRRALLDAIPTGTPHLPVFRTGREAQIAELWQDLLGVQSLDPTENIFARGLDSLLAIRLAEQMRRRLRLELPLHEFLRQPSFEGALACARPAEELAPAPPAESCPEAEHDDFPLTPLQRAYALGQAPGTPLGHFPTLACLEYQRERTHAGRLETAAQRLLEHHATLRIVRTSYDSQRVVGAAPRLLVSEHELRGLSAADQTQHLSEIRSRVASSEWDAARLPRFALDVVQLDDGSRLIFRFDFSLLDYWSGQRLLAQLIQLYEAPCMALPEVTSTFRGFVLGRSARQGDHRYLTAERYWSERAATLPAGPALPEAGPRSACSTDRAGGFVRRVGELPPDLWRALRAESGQQGLTPAGLLIAAFVEVLSLWTDSDSFCVNVPLFDEDRICSGMDAALGDFSTIELLEVTDPYGGRFFERAQRLQAQLWRDFDHRQFDGVDVLRELNRLQGRPLGATMPIVFTSLLWPSGLAGTEAVGRQVWGHSSTPQVGLDCHVREAEGVLHFNWDAVDEIFAPGLIASMFDAFARLLQRLASAPGTWRASHRELARELMPSEQTHALECYNDTRTRLPEGSLHSGLVRWADLEPTRAAAGSTQGILSYGDLLSQARRVGAHLATRSGTAGSVVAVCLPRAVEQLVAACSVLLARGVYLPVSPALPLERLRRTLQDAGVRHVLGDQPGAAATALREIGIEWLDVRECAATAALSTPVNEPLAEELAYVIYTSGSTGTPSGVMTSHGAALNTILDVNRRFGVQADDRVLAVSEPSFDLSIWDIFGMLNAGGAIILPDEARKRDPSHWLDLIQTQGVTVWNSVPTLLEMLVSYAEGMGVGLPASLRLFLVSGDWISTQLAPRVAALCPGARFISLGGATEAAIWSIFHEVTSGDEMLPSVPYGRPLTNQQVHVLGRSLAASPMQVPGELFIGGAGVALGYLGDAAKTAERFVRHPGTGERLYRTGDFGKYMPTGYVEFLGRKDQQVKVRGHRIELGEIESALRRDPRVAGAAVAAIGDPRGSRRLAAFVVPVLEGTLDADVAQGLRESLARTLPDYMLPQSIQVIQALPLTATGKVDRKLLARRGLELAAPGSAGVDPIEGARQMLIEGVWKQVLRVERVGARDNFFELGGDSLLAIQLITRLHRLAITVSVDMLYRHPTIAGLASAGAAESEPDTTAPGPVGDVPVVPGQSWFFEQSLLEPHLWHEGHVLQARGHLDILLLRQVFQLLVTHHHALRSRFIEQTVWTQRIEEDEASDLVDVIQAEQAMGQRLDDTVEHVASGLQRRLSLAHGPLLRAAVIVGPDADQLVLVGHHLVLDGFSWRIVLEDIQTLYRQLQVGGAVVPQQTDSFRAWAHALRDRAARLEATEELSHWARVTSSPLCELQLDVPGTPTAQSVHSIYASVSADVTSSLLHGTTRRATLQEVLLGAWALTARAVGHDHRVVVDLLSHGRAERVMQRSLGRTVGRFSMVFPVRIELPDAGGWTEVIQAARRALAVTPEGGLNYGLLRHMSPAGDVRRALGALPQPQVCLNYAGQFDPSLLDGSAFSSVKEVPRSQSAAMAGERRYVLEINCGIFDGRLDFEWRFSTNVLDESTVRAWSKHVIAHLEQAARVEHPPQAPQMVMAEGSSTAALGALA